MVYQGKMKTPEEIKKKKERKKSNNILNQPKGNKLSDTQISICSTLV